MIRATSFAKRLLSLTELSFSAPAKTEHVTLVQVENGPDDEAGETLNADELGRFPFIQRRVGPQKGHQHGTECEFAFLCSAGQIAKIGAGRFDMRGSLEDAGNHGGGVLRAHCGASLLMSSWADLKHRFHDDGCSHKISPTADLSRRAIGSNFRASPHNEIERE